MKAASSTHRIHLALLGFVNMAPPDLLDVSLTCFCDSLFWIVSVMTTLKPCPETIMPCLALPTHSQFPEVWLPSSTLHRFCTPRETIKTQRLHVMFLRRGLHLPVPNPFIPTDLSLRSEEWDGVTDASAAPTVVSEVPGLLRMWHRCGV